MHALTVVALQHEVHFNLKCTMTFDTTQPVAHPSHALEPSCLSTPPHHTCAGRSDQSLFGGSDAICRRVEQKKRTSWHDIANCDAPTTNSSWQPWGQLWSFCILSRISETGMHPWWLWLSAIASGSVMQGDIMDAFLDCLPKEPALESTWTWRSCELTPQVSCPWPDSCHQCHQCACAEVPTDWQVILTAGQHVHHWCGRCLDLHKGKACKMQSSDLEWHTQLAHMLPQRQKEMLVLFSKLHGQFDLELSQLVHVWHSWMPACHQMLTIQKNWKLFVCCVVLFIWKPNLDLQWLSGHHDQWAKSSFPLPKKCQFFLNKLASCIHCNLFNSSINHHDAVHCHICFNIVKLSPVCFKQITTFLPNWTLFRIWECVFSFWNEIEWFQLHAWDKKFLSPLNLTFGAKVSLNGLLVKSLLAGVLLVFLLKGPSTKTGIAPNSFILSLIAPNVSTESNLWCFVSFKTSSVTLPFAFARTVVVPCGHCPWKQNFLSLQGQLLAWKCVCRTKTVVLLFGSNLFSFTFHWCGPCVTFFQDLMTIAAICCEDAHCCSRLQECCSQTISGWCPTNSEKSFWLFS